MEQMKHRASWSSETLSCVPVGTQVISGNRSDQESNAGLQITYPLPTNLGEPIHKNGYDNVQSQSGDNHKECNVHDYSQAKGRKQRAAASNTKLNVLRKERKFYIMNRTKLGDDDSHSCYRSQQTIPQNRHHTLSERAAELASIRIEETGKKRKWEDRVDEYNGKN